MPAKASLLLAAPFGLDVSSGIYLRFRPLQQSTYALVPIFIDKLRHVPVEANRQ